MDHAKDEQAVSDESRAIRGTGGDVELQYPEQSSRQTTSSNDAQNDASTVARAGDKSPRQRRVGRGG